MSINIQSLPQDKVIELSKLFIHDGNNYTIIIFYSIFIESSKKGHLEIVKLLLLNSRVDLCALDNYDKFEITNQF